MRAQAGLAEACRDEVRVRCRGQREVDALEGVVRAFRGARVRADADGVERALRVCRPLAQRLAEQRDGWHEEQHEAVRAGFLLRDLQRRVRLARAAGHDELAAVVRGVVGAGGVHGLHLVRLRRARAAGGGSARDAGGELFPVDGRVLELAEADARDGRVLVADGVLRLFVPFVRRREPETLREARRAPRAVAERAARRREERVDVLLRDLGCRLIAFALHGPIVAVRRAGHEVDARVLAAEIFAIREVAPHPDVREAAEVRRVRLEERLHEPLEARALVFFRKRAPARLGEDRMEVRHAEAFFRFFDRISIHG